MFINDEVAGYRIEGRENLAPVAPRQDESVRSDSGPKARRRVLRFFGGFEPQRGGAETEISRAHAADGPVVVAVEELVGDRVDPWIVCEDPPDVISREDGGGGRGDVLEGTAVEMGDGGALADGGSDEAVEVAERVREVDLRGNRPGGSENVRDEARIRGAEVVDLDFDDDSSLLDGYADLAEGVRVEAGVGGKRILGHRRHAEGVQEGEGGAGEVESRVVAAPRPGFGGELGHLDRDLRGADKARGGCELGGHPDGAALVLLRWGRRDDGGRTAKAGRDAGHQTGVCFLEDPL